jgi:hypothetical protein
VLQGLTAAGLPQGARMATLRCDADQIPYARPTQHPLQVRHRCLQASYPRSFVHRLCRSKMGIDIACAMSGRDAGGGVSLKHSFRCPGISLSELFGRSMKMSRQRQRWRAPSNEL